MNDAAGPDEAILAVARLDKLLEHRVRLGVCVMLARADEIKFTAFKRALGGTDGNLGAQLRKLEDAGYVTLRKVFEGRRPASWYQITTRGRSALGDHLAALSILVDAAQE